MRTKYFFLSLLLVSIFFSSIPNSSLFSSQSQERRISSDAYIHGLTSLMFYIHEQDRCLDERSRPRRTIEFSKEDVVKLWSKIGQGVSSQSNFNQGDIVFKEAYHSYSQAETAIHKGMNQDAQQLLKATSAGLNKLWHHAIEEENKTMNFDYDSSLRTRKAKDPNLENNPYVSAEAKKAMKPYLLPLEHPMRSGLDSIFLKKRATVDKYAFHKAGFRIIAEGPRSYVLVARHNKLPGYLVKAHYDTELNKKFRKESWEWLVRRCIGAKKIRDIIQTRDIRYFVVADKWLYCFPPEPSPPNDDQHTRHLALVLVTDMELVTEKRNLHAWSHYITKEHLNELYIIISRAKGSSYRPDNIAYTKHHKFAFIDTEYPTSGPDFRSIRFYLNREMLDYWDRLVRNGGPQSS